MYNITDTEDFGKDGLQINFYVDTEIPNEKIYITTRNDKGLFNFLYWKMPDAMRAMSIHKYIFSANQTLKRIYEYQDIINKSREKQDTNMISASNYALTFIGCDISTLIDIINKILLNFIFHNETKFLSQQNPDKYTFIRDIQDFLKRKDSPEIINIYNATVKSLNSLQLMEIVSALTFIYHSSNMDATSTIVGAGAPIATGVEAYNKDGKKYVFHNHNLFQIIHALNAFIKEMEFYNEQ